MSDDVEWESLLVEMNKPKVPNRVPDWFDANKRSIANSNLVRQSYKTRPNSWINVEVAAIFISPTLPINCSECIERSQECTSCNRNKNNFAYCMSANRDSDFLVIELTSSMEEDLFERVDGAIVLFDPSIYPTIDLTPASFSFSSQEMVPVHIASLTVPSIDDSNGMLFLGDGQASVNGDDFVAGLLCTPGNYDIVAWLAWTSQGELAPMAIFCYGPGFKSAFLEDTKHRLKIPDDVQKVINGDSSTNVLARFGNNQDYYAETNANFYGEETKDDWVIKNSWIMLQSYLEDPEEWEKTFMNWEEETETKLLSIETLRIRGKQEVFERLSNHLLENQKDIENWRDLIMKLRKLPPGARFRENQL